ncbi:helix-turn-helix domain-containing protein [Rhizobium setariae]|uniref:helix-turn-helix domain-containing protein n=1 Tax=Rhizobium setariae TaxID=2801340 RepID=UPI001FED3B84|nr:AraC family transcriptional regulator [Rhizobium setariae]
MKPFFEKPVIAEGQSSALLNRRLDDGIPFQWHFHREFELTLTLNSEGRRFIGDHIGTYGDGDLVLLGPNLPHTWASDLKQDESGPHVALVIWFTSEWLSGLVQTMPELSRLKDLASRAGRGIQFSQHMGERVRPLIEAMTEQSPSQRLLGLLEALLLLSEDGASVALASPDRRQQVFAEGDRPRIERVLDHLHGHYSERLTVSDLARTAHLSESGLHRLFRRHTMMTVSEYISQLRVGRACQLLIATQQPIALVATDVGYDNLSNFNKQFKALKGTTPRAFRNTFAR